MRQSATLTARPVARRRTYKLLAPALILLILALALLAGAAVAAPEPPTITVVTPAAGAVWAGQDTQTVAWTLSSAVDVGQFLVGIPVLGSEDSWCFTGLVAPEYGATNYSTSIPVTGVPPGAGYQVWVIWYGDYWLDTPGEPTTGAVSGSFTMQSAAPVPTIRSFSPQRGHVGTVVTLTGSDFGANQGSRYVVFGKTKAKIKSWSATRIRTVVPAQVATGRRALRVRDASRAYKAVTFTVTAAPVVPGGLVGTWSNNDMMGWSETYKFRAAGTFLHRIAGLGTTSTTIGLYRDLGSSIRLFNQFTDGKRHRDETVRYYRDGRRALYINGDHFHKQ